MKKYNQGRNDGMALALKIAKEGGVEALEQEIRDRGIVGVNINLTMKELEGAMEPIKQNCMDTMLAMSLATLHDEFGFGRKRLEQFLNRFSLKANCLGEYVKWSEIVEALEKETGVKAVIRNLAELDTVWERMDA